MKINELLSENELDEIDRRGFLKGLGAAAGLAAVGNVAAAPLKKSVSTDKMSGEKTKKADIESDDKKGSLEIFDRDGPPESTKQAAGGQVDFAPDYDWSNVYLSLKRGIFDRTVPAGRIKFGSGPAEHVSVHVGSGGRHAELFNRGGGKTNSLAKKILNHKGKLLIEIFVYPEKSEIIQFTID
jgi:hypothetical protein